MNSSEDPFDTCRVRAWHLEMRDTYEGYQDDEGRFEKWRAAGRPDSDPAEVESLAEWFDTIKSMIGRGVDVRRLRVVSEPVTDYIRWEHVVTPSNIEAGETVRWLPRSRISDLLLPGNDFWVFDNDLVRFHQFSGTGVWLGEELRQEPEVVKQTLAAFEALWERATDHGDYQLT